MADEEQDDNTVDTGAIRSLEVDDVTYPVMQPQEQRTVLTPVVPGARFVARADIYVDDGQNAEGHSINPAIFHDVNVTLTRDVKNGPVMLYVASMPNSAPIQLPRQYSRLDQMVIVNITIGSSKDNVAALKSHLRQHADGATETCDVRRPATWGFALHRRMGDSVRELFLRDLNSLVGGHVPCAERLPEVFDSMSLTASSAPSGVSAQQHQHALVLLADGLNQATIAQRALPAHRRDTEMLDGPRVYTLNLLLQNAVRLVNSMKGGNVDEFNRQIALGNDVTVALKAGLKKAAPKAEETKKE